MAQSIERKKVDREKEELVESIGAFLSAMSSEPKQQRRCKRCGAVMRSFDATVRLDGTDSEWNLCLPVCPCELALHRPLEQLKKECTVNTEGTASPIHKSWRELYTAAVFETDKSKLSERIAQAEWALTLRSRELFHAGSENLRERQAVDAAIFALHILHTTTGNKGRKAALAMRAA
ncbi:MAG TPA: hypothetical protein VGM18_19220 [Candidatus Sulfotelmatobacter sp.]|jgi:hypothetical protein